MIEVFDCEAPEFEKVSLEKQLEEINKKLDVLINMVNKFLLMHLNNETDWK